MRKTFLFLVFSLSALLIFLSSLWFFNTGSVSSVSFLLLGVIAFLKCLIYLLTGNLRVPAFKKVLIFLVLGGLIGVLIFDLPVIYIFKAWSYPFTNFWVYLLVSLPGWAAFFLVFYDSFKLLHIALDKEYHHLGITKIKEEKALDNFFSYLGLAGLVVFIASISLLGLGAQRFLMASLGAVGAWFILENIEWQKTRRTFLSDMIHGHFEPLFAMIIGSAIFGILFEVLNHWAPHKNWVYYDLPWTSFQILGVPLFLIFSWIWMYIIFLSIYNIIYKEKNLWD